MKIKHIFPWLTAITAVAGSLFFLRSEYERDQLVTDFFTIHSPKIKGDGKRMKRLVVYQSSTGFTKKYAEWISQELKCEIKSIKEVSQQEVLEQDMIIYGGWLMGNMIIDLDKIKQLSPKSLVVFAVGASQNTEKLKTQISEQNHLGEIPLFYMQGGINFEKLGFLKKCILKMVRKSISKKENKTEEDIYMEKMLNSSSDKTDVNNIKSLVEYLGK